jgi:hypothetical protein
MEWNGMEWNGMEWNRMKLKCFLCIQAFQLSYSTFIRMSSSTTAASSDAAAAATAGYRTHYISSWHNYQLNVPSHLHSIAHYNAYCEERAKLYDRNAMVLRDNVVKITGWYWCTGFPAQNCADTNGYVDVRTGKKYSLHGDGSFFKEIIGRQ